MNNHEKFMGRCLQLAELGLANVSPNPMVGAVVVYNDEIIGEGYHQQFGESHAEVNAINDVGNRFNNVDEILSKSTLYVNLEPCSHFGKTPPCADLIIRKNIPKVIIACSDPFDNVNGRGIEKLRNAGVEVLTDVLKEDALFLNRRFFNRIQKQRPYLILKWAQTRDGYFAPADNSQKWISSKESKKLVHKWRSEEDAVLIGKNTALADNPQLTTRLWKGENPIRIVIDKNLELPSHLNIFNRKQPTIIFNAIRTETEDNLKFIELENFDHYLPQMIAYQLYLFDIQSIIIEGGAKTLNMFIEANLWDEARVFQSGEIWNAGIKAPQLSKVSTSTTAVSTDQLHIFYNK